MAANFRTGARSLCKPQLASVTRAYRLVSALGSVKDGYFEGWLSPKRLSRSRRRRCNGVGVFGLNATRYHSGWLRSRLSHASVAASAFGCRATFSRIAPYGCLASLFKVLALDRGCSLINLSK